MENQIDSFYLPLCTNFTYVNLQMTDIIFSDFSPFKRFPQAKKPPSRIFDPMHIYRVYVCDPCLQPLHYTHFPNAK